MIQCTSMIYEFTLLKASASEAMKRCSAFLALPSATVRSMASRQIMVRGGGVVGGCCVGGGQQKGLTVCILCDGMGCGTISGCWCWLQCSSGNGLALSNGAQNGQQTDNGEGGGVYMSLSGGQRCGLLGLCWCWPQCCNVSGPALSQCAAWPAGSSW